MFVRSREQAPVAANQQDTDSRWGRAACGYAADTFLFVPSGTLLGKAGQPESYFGLAARERSKRNCDHRGRQVGGVSDA